jgi:hypothetical protein
MSLVVVRGKWAECTGKFTGILTAIFTAIFTDLVVSSSPYLANGIP